MDRAGGGVSQLQPHTEMDPETLEWREMDREEVRWRGIERDVVGAQVSWRCGHDVAVGICCGEPRSVCEARVGRCRAGGMP